MTANCIECLQYAYNQKLNPKTKQQKILKFIKFLLFLLVPGAGLEPARGLSPEGF